jgi:chromosomal replication initiation ATPase DnaA
MSLQKEIYDTNKSRNERLNKNIKPIKIIQLVEELFNTDVQAKNRRQTTVFGRQAAAYLLRNYTRLSLSEIATYVGISHHTTTLYSIRKCQDLMDTEDWYKEKVLQISAELDDYSLYLSNI